MKKASKYFFTAALAFLTLTGCGNDANEPQVTVTDSCPDFSATIDDSQSRAFDQSWDRGDRIGVSGCNRTNVCYITNAGDGNFSVNTPGQQIYFQDDAVETFTAYYPWCNMDEGAVAIKADTRLQADQKSFDFLWAKATGQKDAPNVAFTFAHKMSKVTLTVKPGNGMSYDEVKLARLSLAGFSHTGSFNVTDGFISVDNVGEAWTFSDFAVFNDTEKTATFSFIFFPQTLAKLLEFTAVLELPDNKSHSLRAAIDFTAANSKKDDDAAKNEWIAGRQYNLSVTLNKTDITIGKCEISPWNEVRADEIIVD